MNTPVPALPSLSGTTSYAYDVKNQLTQEASTRAGGFTNSYAYDAVGNPTTFKGQTRTYNAKNQLTGGTGLAGSFTYDNDGNPTSYNGATVTYNVNDCVAAFGTALTAGYDSDGLRVWKQNTATGQRTYFLYEGVVPVCELDASGNVIATNTWGTDGLISRRTGSSSVFYTFDERGNTVQRTNSTGTVLSSRINDAYGTSGGSSATGDPYDGFGGQYGYYTDTETGLQLCTYRYYDASTGRWINRDPIGYSGGINLYNYVMGNPTNAIDPLGLWVDEDYRGGPIKLYDGVPIAPPGIDILDNIGRTKKFRGNIDGLYPYDPLQGQLNKLAWFESMVKSGGPWDYKRRAQRQVYVNPATGEDEGYNKYETFGNFNFGATGAALGISKNTLLNAAGYIQVKSRTSKLSWAATRFDQPEDYQAIVDGYDWYQKNCK